ARYQKQIEAIAGAGSLHIAAPGDVPGHFDLITLIHVLEHIPNPRALLVELRKKLKPGGMLVIEVPAFMRNPFDLLIADHIVHFNEVTILQTMRTAGYDTVI